VQEGAATFFLGEQQARIVQAGQIVRIPAGVSQRMSSADPTTVPGRCSLARAASAAR
jgi:quercetin dioxygenase-like cupin family protein